MRWWRRCRTWSIDSTRLLLTLRAAAVARGDRVAGETRRLVVKTTGRRVPMLGVIADVPIPEDATGVTICTAAGTPMIDVPRAGPIRRRR